MKKYFNCIVIIDKYNMSALDNEFEQYSNKLNDILSMGAATARVRTI